MKLFLPGKTQPFFLLLLLVIGCFSGFSAHSFAGGKVPSSSFLKTNISKHLWVIKTSNMNRQETTMIATLQGLIAQKGNKSGKPQIYIDTGNKSYPVWLQHLKSEYGITYTYVDNPWDLLQRYVDDLNGFIVYKDMEDSINVATSLAGIKNAIAVDETLIDKAKASGLCQLMDVRGKNEVWLKENYWHKFRHDIAFEQKENFPYQLRDYAVMSKAMVFYDGNTSVRDEIVNSLDQDAAILGWGDASEGENVFISKSSQAGVFTLPADWAANISVLSGIHEQNIRQQTHVQAPKADPNKHYVTFIMTDGDNLQWTLGDFKYDPRWFGSQHRGKFSMGWGIPRP